MEILKILPRKEKEIIKKTVKAIKKGKVVICPTDTVYGLLVDAFNKKANEKLFKIKKRPKDRAIPIFVKDIKTARKLALINKKQNDFLKKVWFTPTPIKGSPLSAANWRSQPLIWCGGKGKITVVLKRKTDCKLPNILFGNKKTIALRVPDYKLVNQLLKRINRPLTGTSANISGRPGSTKIKDVLNQFQNQESQPDLVLDAGNLPKNPPSTIIDLLRNKLRILRK